MDKKFKHIITNYLNSVFKNIKISTNDNPYDLVITAELNSNSKPIFIYHNQRNNISFDRNEVSSIVNVFDISHGDARDLIEEYIKNILKSIDGYDNQHGTTFSTF